MNRMVKIVLIISWRIPTAVGFTPIAGLTVPHKVSTHCSAYGKGNRIGRTPEMDNTRTNTRLNVVYSKARCPKDNWVDKLVVSGRFRWFNRRYAYTMDAADWSHIRMKSHQPLGSGQLTPTQ